MPSWLKDAVFYEIYPQSFCDTNSDGIGDIQGIIEKLDYIKSLGCNAIWLNPLFDSPFLDAGYDVRDYKKVASRYGSNQDLQSCFQQAHARGMHVILDLVPGHTSLEHEWFKQSQSEELNTYSDRYIWTDGVWVRPKQLPFLSGLSKRDGNCVLNFFYSQPALNYGFNEIKEKWQKHYTDPACLETFEAIMDIMAFWLDLGCDGFRVDMADSLVKNDPDKIATAWLWQKARKMLDTDYPNAIIISEWSNPEKAICSAGFHGDFYLNHEEAGAGYRSLMREDGKNYFNKEEAGDIAVFLDEYCKRYEASKLQGYICMITGNHDTTRYTYALDLQQQKLAAAFILTMPGVPFIYYGDEIGMKYLQVKNKEGGYKRTGSRTPMQWSKDKNLGFSNANASDLYLPVDEDVQAPTVEEQLLDQESLLNTYKKLTQLRHQYEDLQADASFTPVYIEQKGYPFVYARGSMTIVINPSDQGKEINIPIKGEVLFSIGEYLLQDDRLTIGGQSFVVFR